ncbi:conserved phage C-terminal domain-containing protein [Macrococcoides caseolyticum]|uniref:conserved phage C-terminal domain-containing protein n=1 Tax=Macrococcoides caseolyticum TaxID=69966 RepID=UPI001F36E57D|nr:conserved phage C-terminal domain-containing protein [Macrococcus caseolyticus]MCE4957830.1 conserved phage C-terminal domain-containing protein [Macrococcus caseolyticus]
MAGSKIIIFKKGLNKIKKIEILRSWINLISGNDNYILVNKFYIEFMRDLQGAVFLSQLTFWADKGKNREGWIYKTQEQWFNETGIKKFKITQITKELESRGIIETKVMKVGGNPIKHYRLLYDNYLKEVEVVLENKQRNIDILKTEKRKPENRKRNSENQKNEIVKKEKGKSKNGISSITEDTLTEITNTEKTTEISSNSYVDTISLIAISYINRLTNRSYKVDDQYYIKLITDLMNENYNIIDLIEVVEKKYYEWRDNIKFNKYIRPESLFKYENFKKYVEEDFSNNIEVTPKFILIEKKKNLCATIINFITGLEKEIELKEDYEFDRLKSEIHSLCDEL